MVKMELGDYTFDWNPTQFTEPKKTRIVSVIQTYASVVSFSWGCFNEGQVIEIEWEWMKEAQYDSLQTLIEADAEVEWNPQDGYTYQVQILDLEGKYFDSSLEDAPYRKDVRLTLVVMSRN